MTNLTRLLYTADDANVPAVQEAIRRVAAGDWRGAAVKLMHAADACPECCEWADRACDLAGEFRAKVPA